MHKDEDPLDLINRSELYPPSLSPTNIGRSVLQPGQPPPDMDDDLMVSPLDTDFTVAGMEKSFSANPAMGTMPMLDLPLEQDARRWSSFGQDPDFARNAYPMNRQHSGPTSAPNNAHLHGSQRPPYPQHRAPGLTPPRPIPTSAANHDMLGRNSETSHSRPDTPLSNAPQTKAEQQRSALQQKLSEAVSSSDNPVDLENLILGILHKATNSTKAGNKSSKEGLSGTNGPEAVTLTKSDALAASQAISKLIKQNPGSAYTVQRRSSKGFLPNAKVCQQCGYAVARDCDLRKHMKRHKKPYGCTYPKCHKRFGAKSDWKRHENSQHFQLEAFRCAELLPLGEACGQHFHREKMFEDHLEIHKLSPDDVQERLHRSKIGKNCQGSFWCGFCKVVVELQARRNAAWDERFDHIARHFEKEKLSIDDWVCAEENRRKKELLKEMDRYVYDDDDERGDIDAVGDIDDDVPLPPPPPPDIVSEMSIPRNNAPPPPPPRPAETSSQGEKRKRTDLEDAPIPPPRRPTRRQTTLITNRYCVSFSINIPNSKS
jgi:hypothetical protein